MNISEVYNHYNIPHNLQDHMYRVAAVGLVIADHWQGKHIDRRAIAETLLLHDMANILKMNFDKHPLLLNDDELDKVDFYREVKENFRKKYGNDEHIATEKIAHELHVSNYILFLIEHRGGSNAHNVLLSDDWNLKICCYSDFRVDPHSITTVKLRFDELIRRYKGSQHSLGNIEENERKRERVLELEKQLHSHVSLPLDAINNQMIQPYLEELRDFDLQTT